MVRKGRSALFTSYHACRAARVSTGWGSARCSTKHMSTYSAYMLVHISTFTHATTIHACLLHMLQRHEMIYSTTPTNHAFHPRIMDFIVMPHTSITFNNRIILSNYINSRFHLNDKQNISCSCTMHATRVE